VRVHRRAGGSAITLIVTLVLVASGSGPVPAGPLGGPVSGGLRLLPPTVSGNPANDAYPAYDLGVLGQPGNVLSRDGLESGLVDGRSLWTFGDTIMNPANADGKSGLSNTGAVNGPGYYPLTEPLDSTGGPADLLVPYTAAEESFNAQHAGQAGTRYITWPSAVIPGGTQDAMIFFLRGKTVNGVFESGSRGVGIADISAADLDNNDLRADRRATLLFGGEDCQWSAQFAAQDGYLYTYADLTSPEAEKDYCPRRPSLPDPAQGSPVGVARVLLSDAGTRGAYRYWDGSGWSSDPNQTVTVFPGILGGADVAWNATLGKYLALDGIGHTSRFRTADNPWGPWSAPQQFVTGLPYYDDGSFGDYAWTQHPELSSDGVLMVSYFHRLGVIFTGEIRLLAVDLRTYASTHLNNYIDRSYDALLGFSADAAAKDHWRPKLQGRTVSTRSFSASLTASLDGRKQTVRRAYQAVFGWSPDAGALAFWAGELTKPGWDYTVLVAKMMSASTFDAYTDTAFVAKAYQVTLNRPVDGPSSSYWVAQLAGGYSRYTMVRSLMGSSEAGRYQAGAAYLDVLGRAATTDEKILVARTEKEATRIRTSVNTTAEAVGG